MALWDLQVVSDLRWDCKDLIECKLICSGLWSCVVLILKWETQWHYKMYCHLRFKQIKNLQMQISVEVVWIFLQT